MNRRTKGVLLVGSLAVATVVAAGGMLAGAFAKVVDPHNYCDTGFSRLTGCTYQWSSTSTGRDTSILTKPTSVDTTSWALAQCPQNVIAKRLLCASSNAAPVQAASDDLTTGLPRPKPWLVTTAKNSPFIKAVHVETPLDLTGVLGFYRVELSKRGWTENGGAVVEPDRALIAFTTADGPALLRLIHQDDRTIVDLSLRKPAAANAAILPKPGQVKLLLGNATDEEAAITINEQTIKLAAGAGRDLTGRKSSDSATIDLPPGKNNVTLKVANGAAQNREFEVATGETWGLLAGPAGVALPVQLY